jgi:hypothetical protein
MLLSFKTADRSSAPTGLATAQSAITNAAFIPFGMWSQMHFNTQSSFPFFADGLLSLLFLAPADPWCFARISSIEQDQAFCYGSS